MKIEVGKYYKTRDGQKVGPMRKTGSQYANMWFTDDEVNHWTKNGTEYNTMPSGRDLISEWIDEPVTGTLRELNVQVGDVVENQKNKYRYMVAPDMTVGGPHVNICIDDYKIISRSSRATQPSPVITETVTTQRIVPGVYGHIWIDDVSKDWVSIGMRNNALKKLDAVGLSMGELSAIITTLTQIRDALTHNSAK